MSVGKVALQTKALNYTKTDGVNVADRWSERLRSYPGRSHEHVEMYFKTWLKQDLS